MSVNDKLCEGSVLAGIVIMCTRKPVESILNSASTKMDLSGKNKTQNDFSPIEKHVFPSLYQNIHICPTSLDKPRILCLSSTLMTYSTLCCFVWPPVSRGVQTGRKEFFLLCYDLENLPSVINQIFFGMCWWTITTLICRAWAQALTAAGQLLQRGAAVRDAEKPFLPSGLNSQCFYLIEEALRWSSRMRCKLCFALLKRFDVQRGNCLSLVLFGQCNMCYCSSVEQKLLFLNAKRSLENVTKFTKRI